MTEQPDINTARQHLLDQLAALRGATVHTIDRELARSKGVSELAQAVTNMAKVEVDYLRATGQTRAPFFETRPEAPALTDESGQKGGVRSVLVNNLWGKA